MHDSPAECWDCGTTARPLFTVAGVTRCPVCLACARQEAREEQGLSGADHDWWE